MNDLEFLKELMSVRTSTYKEELMVQYICDWLDKEGIPYVVDDMMNVYATKTSEGYEGKLYPCMVAHTDTVHHFEDEIHVREEMLPNRQKQAKLSLKAYDPDGQPVGIGGDDKCGVYGALVSLRDLPHVKGAFFVSEETGCWGSRKASPEFFSDVAYAIQLDAPSNHMVTEVCWGVRMFDRESEFFRIADEVLSEKFEFHEFQIHPYTDVSQLAQKFDFSCINFSCGYYNYHTKNEYVVIEDLQIAIHTAHEMINRLGYTKQTYERKRHDRGLSKYAF
jgi:putative aminopeptidase FrvX